MCGIRKLQPPPLVGPPSCNPCRDLNRYLALCGFSMRNLSRCLILILTSATLSSTCSLRLYSDISGGAGPFLVTAGNAAMGYLHIHRQPLRRPIWPCPYCLLLFFRSFARLSGGPTRFKVLFIAQISSVSRSGDPDDRWRYRACHPFAKGSNNVFTAILLTRVYALWERNRIILWSLLSYYVGFAGFAAVRYLLLSNIPFSIHHFLVGDYSRGIPSTSLDTPDFTGMHEPFIEGRVRVRLPAFSSLTNSFSQGVLCVNPKSERELAAESHQNRFRLSVGWNRGLRFNSLCPHCI